jgi:Kdo2-lipid IVA lauroyltransferase/acyltransferase
MARTKPNWLINLEYYPLRGLFSLLNALPEAPSEALSRALVRGVFALLPRRRKLMDDNLAASFPGMSAAERKRIARESLDNLARGIFMFPRMPRFGAKEWAAHMELQGLEHLEKALAGGKGALSFTAHFGCWEAIATYMPLRAPESSLVVRPLDNPKLDHLVSQVRACNGGRIVSKRNLYKEGIRTLRGNHWLGLLIDQNFSPGNLFVDFFGRPAATTSIVSVLARRTGAPVLPIHNEWDGEKMRIILEPPLALSQHPDPVRALAEDTQAMTRIIEGWIRKKPGQWLWMHNRWKRRPQPGEFVLPPSAS